MKAMRSTARKSGTQRKSTTKLKYPWKPRARTKAERQLHALKSHHRSKRGNQPCVIMGCKKMAVMDSDRCAMHRSLQILHVPKDLDLIVYG